MADILNLRFLIYLEISYVGTTDLNDDNIYLYNDSGELIEGFPLKGSSSYDLIDSDMDGKLEIISKIDNFSIVSYEIN